MQVLVRRGGFGFVAGRAGDAAIACAFWVEKRGRGCGPFRQGRFGVAGERSPQHFDDALLRRVFSGRRQAQEGFGGGELHAAIRVVEAFPTPRPATLATDANWIARSASAGVTPRATAVRFSAMARSKTLTRPPAGVNGGEQVMDIRDDFGERLLEACAIKCFLDGQANEVVWAGSYDGSSSSAHRA